jgi:septal ring factor EnvC (AmiA/AmiB activator)
MGNASSRTVNRDDSVIKAEMNEIMTKINVQNKRLDEFIKNSKDEEQMRLTGELVALKRRLTELNDELKKLEEAASASPAAAAVAPAAAAVAPAAAVPAQNLDTPRTQQIYNPRNLQGSPPNLPDFEYPDPAGGTIKRKNSKRKNSKRKNSKRKNSKRKNSKRKNSKRK